jgi:hypothetical protein
MKNLIPLILLLTLNFNSFSQIVTDTTIIKISTPVARLVIKDLVRLDYQTKEISLLNDKINLLENKIILKDSIILNIKEQIHNSNLIIEKKDKQLEVSQNLSQKLQKDLKKEQRKNKILSSSNIVWVVLILILL